MGNMGMTRRRFLGIGAAGAAALALPATALAQAFKEPGIAEDGTLVEGFVKVNGETYGYVGGEMQFGAAEVRGEWYHFDEITGAMTYGKIIYGSGFWLSGPNGILEKPGEIVTGTYDDGTLTTYRIDETTRLATLVEPEVGTGVNIYRLYNPNSSKHVFTASLSEAKLDAEAGWRWEGTAWVAPESGSPVYRLYSKSSGGHMLTASSNERDALVAAGWADEGIAFRTPGNGSSVWRLYNDDDDEHFFTASASEHELLVATGWTDEGVGFGCTGSAAVAIDGFWLVTDAWGSLNRYWVSSDTSLATSRLVSSSEGAGYDAYATETGAVVRGRQRIGSCVLIADEDGKLLLSSYPSGWLVTDDLDDGELQRYYIDPTILGGVNAARVGEFTVGGKTYVGRHDTGYCVRGTYFQDGYLYTCDNDGVLISKTEENWWEEGGYAADFLSGAGLAKLAIRVAPRIIPPDGWLEVDGAWDRTGDSRSQEYLTVCDATTIRWGDDGTGYNPAYASCTQAVSMIARVLWPDMPMEGSSIHADQLRASGRFDEVGFCRYASGFDSSCEPGDILERADGGHTMLYVGNELVRMKYPDSDANVWEAHYGDGGGDGRSFYPGLIKDGKYAWYDGGGYYVFRYNGSKAACKHSYVNPWKLLAGDADWDNQ